MLVYPDQYYDESPKTSISRSRRLRGFHAYYGITVSSSEMVDPQNGDRWLSEMGDIPRKCTRACIIEAVMSQRSGSVDLLEKD